MYLLQKCWNLCMSEKFNKPGNAEDLGFERRDLTPKAVFAFLISLAIIGVLIHFALKGMFGYFEAYERQHQPAENPLVKTGTELPPATSNAHVDTTFPEPRLERNERLEINSFRLQEEQTLHSYGWVDQPAGVVRIPIDRAMQLIAERGLPTRPQAGTVPPSPVNLARQAAERSDTSQQQQKKK
jgi:hypothetical protein